MIGRKNMYFGNVYLNIGVLERLNKGLGDDFSSFSRIGREEGGHDCQDERGNRFHKWWTLRDLRLILIITRFRSSLRGPLLYPLFIRWLAHLSCLLRRTFARREPGRMNGEAGRTRLLGHKDIYQVTTLVILYDPCPS